MRPDPRYELALALQVPHTQTEHPDTSAVAVTNVIVAAFRKCRDLVGEGKVFIKDKAKVASRVGCSERRVVNFRKLLLKSNKKKLSMS